MDLSDFHLSRLRKAAQGRFNSRSGDQRDANAGDDLRRWGLIDDNDDITPRGHGQLAGRE